MDAIRDNNDGAAEGKELLEQLRRSIVEAVNPRCIVVFGSRARGDARPGSDVDLLVVVEGEGEVDEVRVAVRRAIRHIGIPKDVIVVTKGAFDKWSRAPGSLVRSVLTDGIVIHGSA